MDQDNLSVNSQSTNYSIRANLQNGNLTQLLHQKMQQKFELGVTYLLRTAQYVTSFSNFIQSNTILQFYKTYLQLMRTFFSFQEDFNQLVQFILQVCSKQYEEQLLLQLSDQLQDIDEFEKIFFSQMMLFLKQSLLDQQQKFLLEQNIKKFNETFIVKMIYCLKKANQETKNQNLLKKFIIEISDQSKNKIYIHQVNSVQVFNSIEKLTGQLKEFIKQGLDLIMKFNQLGLIQSFNKYKNRLFKKDKQLYTLKNKIKQLKYQRQLKNYEDELIGLSQQLMELNQEVKKALQGDQKVNSQYKIMTIQKIKINLTSKINFMKNKETPIIQSVIQLIHAFQYTLKTFLFQRQFNQLKFHREIVKKFKKSYQTLNNKEKQQRNLFMYQNKLEQKQNPYLEKDQNISIQFLQYINNFFVGVLSQHQSIKNIVLLFLQQVKQGILKIKQFQLKKEVILQVLIYFQKDSKLQKSINSPKSSQNSKSLQENKIQRRQNQVINLDYDSQQIIQKYDLILENAKFLLKQYIQRNDREYLKLMATSLGLDEFQFKE